MSGTDRPRAEHLAFGPVPPNLPDQRSPAPESLFDLRGVSDQHRQEAWSAALSDGLMPMSVEFERDGSRRSGKLRRYWLDDLALVDCYTAPINGSRSTAQIRSDGSEYVALIICMAGRERLTQGDHAVEVHPGSGVVVSSARPFRFTVESEYRKLCLTMPRQALESADARIDHTACSPLPGEAAPVRLLAGYLAVLTDTLPQMGPAARLSARNATLQLVRGAFALDSDSTESSAISLALKLSIDRWIDRNLRVGSDLTPESAAAAHMVSVRTIHRAFSTAGTTFSATVRMQRLTHARDDLARGDLAVSSVAAHWGFADSSHLARQFKMQFGMTPTAYREQVALHGAVGR
jgi:AraC-like DNA-binding protein